MKIALVHNFYQQAGGEDAVFRNERDLLAAEANEVVTYTLDNAAITGPRARIAAAVNAGYSRGARHRFAQWLADNRPDVVHIHNFFPLLSPSIYDACEAAGIPIVQTLHNFRTTCAGALLLRDGVVCEKCVGSSPVWGVVHRCYRGSAAGSLSVTGMIGSFRRRAHKVSRFIALTEFARTKFIAAGIEPARITVKPNFVAAPPPAPRAADDRPHGLYVGRLSPEKGVDVLVKAWRDMPLPLHIAGDGPLRASLAASAAGNVEFLGGLPRERITAEMATASFLVVPSTWYEMFPMVIVEAFAMGLPVIASRIGSLGEIITHGETGLQFAPGDAGELAQQVAWAITHPAALRRMGATARATYERLYSPAANYQALVAIYRDAIADRPRERMPA